MRKDMAKVIVERPRYGGGIKTPRGSLRRLHRVPMEDWHAKESMRECWNGCRKHLNENLTPLRRFLRSKIGQHWDDINSELRERINLKSTVQFHIWQHVIHYVCIHTMDDNGRHLASCGREIRESFYVDPVTKVLRENPYRHQRKAGPPIDYIRIDLWNQYRKLNGIWYHVQLKPLPENLALTWDTVLKNFCIRITARKLEAYYGSRGYAVAKRQLNSKEIAAVVKSGVIQRD